MALWHLHLLGDFVLSMDHFNEVNQTCEQFSAKWEKIGGRLDIRKNTIDIIARNNNKDAIKCMSELIATWLKRETREQPLPTWSILCDAIATVDRTAAEKIATDKGCQLIITHTEHQVHKGSKKKCKPTGDLLYVGKIYYHREGANSWSAMFVVVKNLRVLQKYMRRKHPYAEEGNTLSFCFIDEDDGFVGLDFQRKEMSCCKGWVVKPMDVHKKLLKAEVDYFGLVEAEDDDPPSYWITIYAEKTDGTEPSLKYIIPMTGVKKEKEICIVRHLEYDTETDIALEPQKQLKQETDIALEPQKQLKQIVTDEVKRNFAEHSKLSQESVATLAKEMVESHMISRVAAKKPNIDVLINHFLSDLETLEEFDEIRDYCKTFLSLFDRLDSKPSDVADEIRRNIAAFHFQ